MLSSTSFQILPKHGLSIHWCGWAFSNHECYLPFYGFRCKYLLKNENVCYCFDPNLNDKINLRGTSVYNAVQHQQKSFQLRFKIWNKLILNINTYANVQQQYLCVLRHQQHSHCFEVVSLLVLEFPSFPYCPDMVCHPDYIYVYKNRSDMMRTLCSWYHLILCNAFTN